MENKMSHPNVEIQINGGKTYLIINEYDGEGGSVPVTLTRGSVISNNPTVYAGILMYGTTNIDVIQAHFSNASNADNVTLEISLGDSGNAFTSHATDSDGNSLQYISQTIEASECGQANGLLVFTYSEPPVDTSILKEVYFHTSLGTIDPMEGIERDPT